MCSIDFAGRNAELMRSSGRAAGRESAGAAIQYMPCATHSVSSEASRAAIRVIGEMLPRYWALGQRLGSAKEALLSGTNIGEDEFSSSASRIRAGEDPARVLDDRYASAFALSGTPDECLRRAGKYKAMGIDELALTFSGPRAKDEIAAIGAALARIRGSPDR
jgi:5,10-methylenetetrahydromethanopterin reductase